MTKQRCGYVAIIGRPNVGKSTLINRILGQKISIISRKPQTTRHQILGVKTHQQVQALYVDTPGIHCQQHHAINRYMNRAATSMIHDVDVIIWVLDLQWTPEEDRILQYLQGIASPVIGVLNKVDQAKDKATLLPKLAQLQQRYTFQDIIPLCAKQVKGVSALEAVVAKALPQQDWLFPEDQVTDRSLRFMAAELIREQLMRHLGQELPYVLTVEIDAFNAATDGCMHIMASIIVNRASQKAMIIGKRGSKLKEIGRLARLAMNQQFAARVHLQLWVKVKSGWDDDERALRSLGYDV